MLFSVSAILQPAASWVDNIIPNETSDGCGKEGVISSLSHDVLFSELCETVNTFNTMKSNVPQTLLTLTTFFNLRYPSPFVDLSEWELCLRMQEACSSMFWQWMWWSYISGYLSGLALAALGTALSQRWKSSNFQMMESFCWNNDTDQGAVRSLAGQGGRRSQALLIQNLVLAAAFNKLNLESSCICIFESVKCNKIKE